MTMTMTLTAGQAKALVEQCGSTTAAAAKAGVPRTTFQGWLNGTGERRAKAMERGASERDEAPAAAVTTVGGGFVLTGRRMLASKPTDVWKGRFFALRKGMGYPLEHLREEWGSSVETIRVKAKRLGALRYVEDAEQQGQYMECAVHPDTPKGK